MMRVLLVHNFYGSSVSSGENQVFDAERAMLVKRGDEVQTVTRHSDEIRSRGAWGVVCGAMSTAWNPWSARSLRKEVERFRPDVVHAHNTFPLLSPVIFHAIGNRAARILTLHNYRLFCSAAIPMRSGQVCTECLDKKSAGPALRYGCYRGSRLATLPLAVSVGLHRRIGTWTRQVDAFIALTEFQREIMVRAGLPAALVHVKPNFYPGNPRATPWTDRGDYAVFAGRLTLEKGVETLVRAWLNWGKQAPELRILGDGPLRGSLEKVVASDPLNQVRFLGQVSSRYAERQIAEAKLLVVPSNWFEGFPMVLREGLAFGTPLAVSCIGPLPSIVKHGVSGIVFTPGDAHSLLHEVRHAWETRGMLQRLSAGARRAFESSYTEDVNYHTLVEIYAAALAIKNERARQ